MHISQYLRRAADLWGDKEAVVDGADRFTYRQVSSRVRALSVLLQSLGVKRGQVVSVLAPNCHEFLEAYFACSWAGIILNPINYRLASREVGAILRDAGSVAVLVHADFQQLLIDSLQFVAGSTPQIIALRGAASGIPSGWLDYELEAGKAYLSSAKNDFAASGSASSSPDFGATANLYYTSGTTGEPKGVMLTYENVSCHALCAVAELKLSDSDTWLHAAPMFHLADAWATFAITVVGGKHVMIPYFRSQDALCAIETEKITVSNLIPTMLNAIVNHPDISRYSFASLRTILSGGSPISPETVRRIISTFGCEYIQTYGMTETSPYLTLSIPKEHMKDWSLERLTAVRSKTGRPFMGAELKVVRPDGTEVEKDNIEVGEIIARGPIVTPGYWNKPDETAAAIKGGWLHTGDLAVIDGEGYLNIVDRKKDMIITGGENVYSTEVEYVLYEHKAVLECAVFGLPDVKWGEAVTAAVVLRGGFAASEAQIQELILFVKERIAHYKAPRTIEFLSELPKTGSGKIQKKALRDSHLKATISK